MSNSFSKISPKAKIGKGVKIESFVSISDDVEIGEGCWIGSNVTIMDGARIGNNCKIFPGAVISAIPQDLKFGGEDSIVKIGDNTTIREFATVNRATNYSGVTSIGDNCLIMAYVHIAHDCHISNNVILVNSVQIGGHVEISDYVYLGGQSAVHQYCRIGKHAIIGAGTTIDGDVIPFTSVIGSRGYLSGLNLIGLKRRSFNKEEIKTLRNVYRLLFAPEGTFNERLTEVKETYKDNELVREILIFLRENLNRPLVHPKMDKHL